MGTTVTGRNMWVAVGIQTSMTNVASIMTYFQPTEVGGFLKEFATIDSARRLGSRFSAAPYLGTQQVPFSFTVEANTDDIGRLLFAICGADTMVTTATGVYTHTFTFSAVIPYITVYGYLAGVADSSGNDRMLRITGAKISQATLAGGVDNVLTLALEGIGVWASAMTAATYSFTTNPPLFLNSAQGTGTLSIASAIASVAKFDEAREFELVINNNVSADHRIHGAAVPVGVSEGASECTGRFTAVYNQQTYTEIDNFAAGNNRALILTATGPNVISGTAYYPYVLIGVDKMRYSGGNPSWDPDVVTIELPFTAEVSVSTYIALRSDKSLPYSPAA